VPPNKQPLTQQRITTAAIALLDQSGVGALTMRRLGGKLGVEAMSLYKHVANKDQLLADVVEHIISEIRVPDAHENWRKAIHDRAQSAREVLTRHPWAIGLMESRATALPATRTYLDRMLGILRNNGFTIEHAASTLWLTDSFVYGHVIQEINLTSSVSEQVPETVDTARGETLMYPNLVALEKYSQENSFSFDTQFTQGLDSILNAVEVRLRGNSSERELESPSP
jgi:AcrR family transcriptional regulator